MVVDVSLPKPCRVKPAINLVRSKERRDWILGRMYKLAKSISQHKAAIKRCNAPAITCQLEVNAPYIG